MISFPFARAHDFGVEAGEMTVDHDFLISFSFLLDPVEVSQSELSFEFF